ncbi:hypothetical protein ACH4Y0_02615 [Streptomyces sp. NPDC020707]|uniref:hypothetical protein n=1 Tax=Streptomyces sp. NPDC020707 TaxID=3365084 RepID=UPI0037B7F016
MILLTGLWDVWEDNLLITGSHNLADDDEAATARIVADLHPGNGWAASFLVHDHKRAVQKAYDTYVSHESGSELIDEVHHFEPDRD